MQLPVIDPKTFSFVANGNCFARLRKNTLPVSVVCAMPPNAQVAQQENNGFGPIFEPRGRRAVGASWVVVLISTVVLWFISSARERGILFLVFGAALLTLSAVLGELLRRVCLLIEEIGHKKTRYQGHWNKVFDFAFGCCRTILVVAVFAAMIVFFALNEHYEAFSHPDYVILFALNCLLVPQLVFLVGVRELSPVEISEINEKENKNVADGLAWSYYFGYLKLVLPKLIKQISKSEKFRHKIVRKLFILLPRTCYAYDDIAQADERVKFVGRLPRYLKSRAGVKARSYQHTVYRIEMPGRDGKMKEYHFILEYATPLASLYAMSEHERAPLTRPELDNQVMYWSILIFNIAPG